MMLCLGLLACAPEPAPPTSAPSTPPAPTALGAPAIAAAPPGPVPPGAGPQDGAPSAGSAAGAGPASGAPTPGEWSGTWDFPQMALQLAIVDTAGTLAVSATNTKSAHTMPCQPLVVGETLACTIHSATTGKEMNITLAPVGMDPHHFDHLTLSVGGYPVESGARLAGDATADAGVDDATSDVSTP